MKKLTLKPSSALTQAEAANNTDVREREQHFMAALRSVPGLVEAASTLNRGQTYRIVFEPEGGELLRDAAGRLRGVFYKNGRICEFAKLQPVGVSVLKTITGAAAQLTQLALAIQLARIEKTQQQILGELHGDRLSEVASGVALHEQAHHVRSAETRKRLATDAIVLLNTGLAKITRNLKAQIAEAPEPGINFLDNWLTQKTSLAEEAFARIHESFSTCLVGIQSLANCYAILDEPAAAAQALRTHVDKLADCNLATAARKARLVPLRQGSAPAEAALTSYIDNLPVIEARIAECAQLAQLDFAQLQIEIRPEQLLENSHEM